MQRISNFASELEFDYGFVNQFDQQLNIDVNKLSKVAVLSTNPCEILPECKTVIVLAIKYEGNTKNNFARFSWGEDYHTKIKNSFEELANSFDDGILLVDTHSLNERYFASKSGIGYIGKNSMFISDKFGSFCHLALILTSEHIVGNRESKKRCGECVKCINACPVNAIENQIDCRKCISEKLQSRNNLEFDKLLNVYGCDECQNVCPHNKVDNLLPLLYNEDSLVNDLYLSKKEFVKYKNHTFYWIGYRSYIRNVHVAYVNQTGDISNLDFLEKSNSIYLQEVSKKLKGGR